MKKRLIKAFGFVLLLPIIINIVMPMLGMIAHKSIYERWLFESVIFKMLEWADGSYFRAAGIWLGSTVFFLSYTILISRCFLYQTAEDRRQKYAKIG